MNEPMNECEDIVELRKQVGGNPRTFILLSLVGLPPPVSAALCFLKSDLYVFCCC